MLAPPQEMHAESTSTTIACPVCGPERTERELEVACRSVALVRCAGCGLVFRATEPSSAAVAAAHEETYGSAGRRFGRPAEQAIRLFVQARVRLALRLLPRVGRVLDIGCGRGTFLVLLEQRGHTVRGLEFSEAMAGQSRGRVPVDVGELAPGRYAPASFDLVCIWHVLEHARRPDLVLAGAREALAPHGALLLAMPNYDSLQARWGREHWFPLDPARHLFHFTPATLRRLLEANGFRIEQLRTGQWEMDPFAIVQTAMNRLGFPRDALFASFSNNPAVRGLVTPALRLVLLAAGALALPAACVASLFERARGRGGSMIVVARPV